MIGAGAWSKSCPAVPGRRSRTSPGGALSLAQDALNSPARGDERMTHVGTWLIGEGRPELVRLLGCGENWRHRFLQWIYRRSSAVFFSCLGILTAGSIASFLAGARLAGTGGDGASPGVSLLLTLLLVLPASQLALEVLNYLAARILPPRALPKMDFEITGVPEEFRTLVVVPVLLGDDTSDPDRSGEA